MDYIGPHRSAIALAALSAVLFCVSGCNAGRIGNFGDSDAAGAVPNAGLAIPSTPVHRLTRLEYNNTVHDLLGTNLTPADAFPVDPVSDGYDSMASNLTLTPQLIGLYNQAAQTLANEVTTLQPRWSSTSLAQSVGTQADPTGSPESNWGWTIRGQFNVTVNVPQDDNATINVLAGGQATNAPTPQMAIQVDGTALQTFTVTAQESAPQTYSVTTAFTAGKHTVSVVLVNGLHANGTTARDDSELAIGSVIVASTVVTQSPGYHLLFVCDPNSSPNPTTCWQQIVTNFTERAWRRPLTASDQNSILGVWSQLTSQLDSLSAFNFYIRSALVSSPFIYHAIRPGATVAGGSTVIDDYDMAGRLSYFLWSSMPDAQLLQDASNGLLRTPAGITSEVQRMLADPNKVGGGLLNGFAAQWLDTRELSTATPDPNTFPNWDATLVPAFTSEAQLFFGDYLTNQLPVSNMLAPNFAYLNDRLAQLYQLPAPGSTTPVRVTLPAGARSGILSQGAWLVSNSVQTRTSVVKRGRFIMQNLLCTPISPPPAGVPPLPDASSTAPQTQRQMLAAHVANPTCAACHNIIDPPGFGVELYDGIGASRTTDNGLPIDATGTLAGQNFNGPTQLAQIIGADSAFEPCLAQQLYMYALNRAVTSDDTATLSSIVSQAANNGHRLDALIAAIASSDSFRLAPNK